MRGYKLLVAVIAGVVIVFLFSGYYRQFDADKAEIGMNLFLYFSVVGVYLAATKKPDNPNPPTPPPGADGRP